MSINREVLHEKLIRFVKRVYTKNDLDLVLRILKEVVIHDPVKKCEIKGDRKLWNDLPRSKSLFKSNVNCGLPMGNLTSQVFANFYLTEFDRYVKEVLDFEFYGRYVDDFVIIHDNQSVLKSLIPKIRSYMIDYLGLHLHPNKIYLQHYKKGLPFLGAFLMPGRVYAGRRLKSNFFQAAKNFNATNPNSIIVLRLEQSTLNSYLGLISQYSSFRIRKKVMLEILYNRHRKFFIIQNKIRKVTIRSKFKKVDYKLIREYREVHSIPDKLKTES